MKAAKMFKKIVNLMVPPDSRRRLFARALLKLVKNPSLIPHVMNRTNWNKFIYFRGVLRPEEIEKRLDRKFAEYGGAQSRVLPGDGNGYLNHVFRTNSRKDSAYADISDVEPENKSGIRKIAFYLPQYHPIPENDCWWGKGFTEWNNVGRGIPQFTGHYQPKLPGELGYYDLRVPQVRRRQAELAAQYGIFGFCFHFYWFAGKTLLEAPLKDFAEDESVTLPFCINWANENWTRSWDGLEREVLIKQSHSEKDDIAFIEHISSYLKHRNYIRINTRPLILVYRPSLLPDARSTAQRWRKWCRNNGIGEIYLAATHTFEHINPESIGFDAAVEFAPNTFPLEDIISSAEVANPDFTGQVFDYRDAIRHAMRYKKPDYKKFRGICPGWDNDPRKPGNGIILANSSPEAYGEWMDLLCDYTKQNFEKEERLVFINAWNEWAEGAYLEPDRKYGYAYLLAGAKARGRKRGFLTANPFEEKINSGKNDTAVIAHVYYPELWEELCGYLSNIKSGFDLFVSVPEGVEINDADIFAKFGGARIYRHENRGRDIFPFLRILSLIENCGYRYALKIHTKKSSHRKDGNEWRRDLYRGVAGTYGIDLKIRNIFDSSPKTGIIAPGSHILSSDYYWGQNAAAVKKLAGRAGYGPLTEKFNFAAGSMFWFRPRVFKPVLDLNILDCEFEKEEGQLDGTLAHSLERFFGLMALKSGFKIVPSDGVDGGTEKKYKYADAARRTGKEMPDGECEK